MGQRVRQHFKANSSIQGLSEGKKTFTMQLSSIINDLKTVFNGSLDSENVTAATVVKNMMNVVKENGIDWGLSVGVMLYAVEEDAKLFDLLQGVAQSQLKMDRFILGKPVQDTVEFLQKMQAWYEALIRIEMTMSTYGMSNSLPLTVQPGPNSYEPEGDILVGQWYNLLVNMSQFSGNEFPISQPEVEAIIGEDIARQLIT